MVCMGILKYKGKTISCVAKESTRYIKHEAEILAKLGKSPYREYFVQMIAPPTDLIFFPMYRGDLYNLVDEFAHDERVSFIKQTSIALEYLHGLNYGHFDVKPENIMIDQMCRARLGDFGLSSRCTKYDSMILKKGTPGYRAPEVVSSNKKSYGWIADSYSFGATIYLILVKQCFHKDWMNSSFPKDYSWRRIINGLTNSEPTKRFDMTDFMESLIFE